MALPSWLQVTPRDYTQSSQAGGQAGLEAAGIAQRGQIARDESIRRQQQLALEAQAQSQRYSMEQDRLAQQMSIAQMETQARKEIAQQQAARNQQQIALSNAMRQEQLGIAQGHLERQQMMDQERIKAAASAYQDQQGFADAIASGVPVAEALRRFPRTPKGIVSTLAPGGTRNYGPIETVEIPGFGKGVYRKGSPGIHFQAERASPEEQFARMAARDRLRSIAQELASTDDAAAIKKLNAERAAIMQQFGTPKAPTVPEGAGAPFEEGKTIYDRAGRPHVVRAGRPVPADQEEEPVVNDQEE